MDEKHDESDHGMTWEEANHTLETEAISRYDVVDNVYPWWVTLRKPLLFVSFGMISLAIAVLILGLAVRGLVIDDEAEREKNECYQAFGANSSEVIARVRAAATRLDAHGWDTLVRYVSGENITEEEVLEVGRHSDEAERALILDMERIQQRDEWVASGKPLPCPVTPPGVEEG